MRAARPARSLARAHIRSTTRSLVTYEPVSGHSRTGLSLAATDIEKCPPETRVPNPALRDLNSPAASTETGARRPNPREYRGFSHTQIPQRRDRTGWLRMQARTNRSHDQNSQITGKILGIPNVL